MRRPGCGFLTGVRFTPASFLLDSPLLCPYPCCRTRAVRGSVPGAKTDKGPLCFLRAVGYIDKIESHQLLKMHSRVGRRASLQCTALGKALLAFQPAAFVDRFLRRCLKAYTPSTLTDPVALRQELAREAAADASRALGGAEVRRD